MVLGSQEQESRRRVGLVNQAKAWGWNALAEEPGREIIFGAATQPWIANPVFRGIAPEELPVQNGFGIVGRVVGIAASSRNVAAGLGIYGAALSFYDLWLVRGHDVVFRKIRALRSPQHHVVAYSRHRQSSKSPPYLPQAVSNRALRRWPRGASRRLL